MQRKYNTTRGKLREALLVGPAGSYKTPTRGSERVMGYRGMQRSQDWKDFEDEEDFLYESKKRRTLKETREASINPLKTKDIRSAVLGAFKDYFEGDKNITLARSFTSEGVLEVQILGKKKTITASILVTVHEKAGVYTITPATKKDEKNLPDLCFRGKTVDEAGRDGAGAAKDIAKFAKEILSESAIKKQRKALNENYGYYCGYCGEAIPEHTFMDNHGYCENCYCFGPYDDNDYAETASSLDANDWDETDDPLYGYGEDDLQESTKLKESTKGEAAIRKVLDSEGVEYDNGSQCVSCLIVDGPEMGWYSIDEAQEWFSSRGLNIGFGSTDGLYCYGILGASDEFTQNRLNNYVKTKDENDDDWSDLNVDILVCFY